MRAAALIRWVPTRTWVSLVSIAATIAAIGDGAASAGVSLPTPGAISATTLKTPDKPASVKGLADEASVNVFSAQVTHSVPIDLPAGPAGFGPSMALTYSGDLGNGPLGVGWSMGTAAIRRTLRHGVPAYDDADELELVGIGGGGRLVPDGAVSDRYWVEGRGHAMRVDRQGFGFVVRDENGVSFELGTTTASLEQSAGHVSAWHLERTQDVTRRQQIAFSYLRDRNRLYLQRINWGPTVGGGPAFSAVVDFEDRPDRVTSWATGFEIVTAKRITTITVHSFGEMLRRYSVTYEMSPQLSRVKTISMIGRGGHDSLPPLTLGYVQSPPAVVRPLEHTEGWKLNERDVSVFDVDGDGMADLLRLEMGNHQWRKNIGGAFADPRPITGAGDVDLQIARFMDLDGDARPELVRIVDDTWRVSKLISDGADKWRWEPQGGFPGTQGVPLKAPDTVFADLNGDGRTDVIQGAAGSIRVRFMQADRLGPVIRLPPISKPDSDVEIGKPEVRFDDVNGDGLADVVWLTDEWMKIFLGRGDGTFAAFNRVYYPWGRAAFDDGDLQLADLNRDGLLDLVRFTAAHAVWYPGRADGSLDPVSRFVMRPVGASADSVVTIADVNGNGSHDIVWSEPAGMWALDLAGSGSAGMLSSIANGLGRRTTFAYLGSATLSVQDEAAGQAWLHKLPTSVPVPVSVQVETEVDGNGAQSDAVPKRTVLRHVRDGVWDVTERRFAGFTTGETTTVGANNAETLVTVQRFDPGLGPNRVLRGMVTGTETRDADGRVFVRASSTWSACTVAAGPPLPVNPLLRKAVKIADSTVTFEGGASGVETRAAYFTDAECRVDDQIQLGRLDVSGDEKRTRVRYASDDDTWVRDRVCETAAFDAAGVKVPNDPDLARAALGHVFSRSRNSYGDDLNVLPSDDGTVLGGCGVGRGWLRSTRTLLMGEPAGDRWIEQSRTAFSALGNPVTTYASGVVRTLGYDNRDFHPTSESISPRPNKTLTWTMTWDDVLGQPSTMTDPNRQVTRVDYDGLARLVGIRQGGANAHVRYAYDWSAPRPTTTTFVYDGALGSVPAQPGLGWRQSLTVTNGAGEDLFAATRLQDAAGDRWIVSGWKERDKRGKVVVAADPFYFTGALSALTRPATTPIQSLGWDAQGRPSSQRLPNGGEKSWTYAPFAQTVASSELAPVTTTLDGLGRITNTTRTVAGVAEVADAVYDVADRLTVMNLQGGRARHEFRYDSLGRLTRGWDTDVGERRLEYDDRNFLVRHTNGEGQALRFAYDDVGRLLRRWEVDPLPAPASGEGERNVYAYTYDDLSGHVPGRTDDFPLQACFDAAFNQAGRLATVIEPNGRACFGYDELGRQNYVERALYDGVGGGFGQLVSSVRTIRYAASGLLTNEHFDDGFDLTPTYDSAGRLVRLGNLWRVGQDAAGASALDAAGRVLQESFGNGVFQTWERDVLGLPKRIAVSQGALDASDTNRLYDVGIIRNLYGAPTVITDTLTARGLDHGATFAYDEAARLVRATLGGQAQWEFRYRYDGMQNLIARAARGPAGVVPVEQLLDGVYRHGENGRPRQLTSVVSPRSSVLCGAQDASTFGWDAAGRMIAMQTPNRPVEAMVFDALDQLREVKKNGTTAVTYAYGYDGFRTVNVAANGSGSEFFFAEDHVVRPPSPATSATMVEHVVTVGDRAVARVRGVASGTTLPAFVMPRGELRDGPQRGSGQGTQLAVLLAIAALLAWGLGQAVRRRRWRPVPASAVAAALALTTTGVGSCGTMGGETGSAFTIATITYIHQGVAAGPVMFTDAQGAVVGERRYEPFGVLVDEAASTAAPRDPLNTLNKETDRTTGWSYHGARWMVPEIAAWMSGDPAGRHPLGVEIISNSDRNPYGYVSANPEIYWDRTGEFKLDTHRRVVSDAAAAAHLRINIQSVMAQMRFMDSVGQVVSKYHVDNNNFGGAFEYANEKLHSYAQATQSAKQWSSMYPGKIRPPDPDMYLGAAAHVIADFYAHSNWVELYREFDSKAGPNDVPTFEDVFDKKRPNYASEKSAAFRGFLSDKTIRTGEFSVFKPSTYPEFPLWKNRHIEPAGHGIMNKDDPSRANYDFARDTATRATRDDFLYGSAFGGAENAPLAK